MKSTISKNRTTYAKEDASSLEEFFIDELKDVYWAEKHLTKILPKMQKAATSDDLKQVIADHLKQTEGHVTRLENVFEILGHRAEAKKCDAIEGITTEGESIIGETKDHTLTRDVGIIMASQKVEHYEIATYGALVQLAKTLEKPEIAIILSETLEEEKRADVLLTEIAVNHVNAEAFLE